MRITPLADHPAHVDTLAAWHHDEWHALAPAFSLAQRRRMLASHRRDRIPCTLIALEAGDLLGSASLVPDDLPVRPELGPWLSAVYVRADRRGEGIGTALTETIVDLARRLDVPRLYLFTWNREGFYARLGWEVVERPTVRGHEIAVMTRDSG